MNSLRILRSIALLSGLAAVLSAAEPKDLVVINFLRMPRDPGGEPQRAYEYSFGDWQEKRMVFQVADEGLIINHAGSKGGVGENRGLDFRKHTKARISFIIGNRNQASSFSFGVVDSDGTDCAYDISLQGRPAGVVQEVLIDLTQPSRTDKPGTKPGLDLKKLESWQFRGNYQAQPIEVLIQKVTAAAQAPKPAGP